MSILSDIFNSITHLSRTTGDALQLRGFKPGGTAGQVPVKINGTDFNWAWASTLRRVSSLTPPDDTTVLWEDPRNGRLAFYVSGGWVALN